jgi:hypothetical protein
VVKLDSPAWRKHRFGRLHAFSGLSRRADQQLTALVSNSTASTRSHSPVDSNSPSLPLSPSFSPGSITPSNIVIDDDAVRRFSVQSSSPGSILPSNIEIDDDVVRRFSVSTLPPLELHGARSTTSPARLFKLRGFFAGQAATLLLDSGASSEFIDPKFATRCGLTLAKSERTIKLADGAIVDAQGCVDTECSLEAAKGAAIPFTALFTATPLEGYDAILGVSWLEAHDPIIGWKNRLIKPLECLEDADQPQLATLTLKGLRKAHRRGEIDELYAIIVRPKDEAVTTAKPVEDPEIAALLEEFRDVFPDKLVGLPPIRGVKVTHAIELKPGSRPPPCRPLRHQSSKDLAVFEEYTRTLIEAGQLRVSNSPYGAMALIVRKKDGTPRVVIDYRALNELTVKNKYPLPLMDELFDRVIGAKYFSKLDLRTGFHQIRIADADVEKTAFRTRYGSFEYLVLPMGLCNAPSTFMQMMNETFRDMLDRWVLVFLDDILVFSRTKEEHIDHVRKVLMRLREHKLYAKLSKCEFFRSEVEFLGHRLSGDGLSVSQDKVDSVQRWPIPRSVHDVRSFLGLAGFYRQFVKDYSKIALPLTELTKESKGPFEWGSRQRIAFDTLKRALCTTPILLIPDPSLPYTLNCDASDYAIGATLQQDQGRGLQPIAYMSRKLKPAEMNYDIREKEFMALVSACSYWRHYLHSDLPFTLLSDHDSLKYHKTMPHLSGRLARWIEKMAEFDYKIEPIAGAKNIVADALSRRPDLKDLSDPRGTVDPRLSLKDPERVAAVALDAERLRAKASAEEVNPPALDRPAPNAKGSIVMPSHLCTAHTKKGTLCRQRTAKGQYCWNHLRSIHGLRIKKSTVPNAGFGLFADRRLSAGTDIDYTGDRVPLDSDSDGGVYFLKVGIRTAIDAARTDAGEGRWVNDPRGTDRRANSVFVLYTPPGRPRQASVRTLRPIEKGEEIMVKYGGSYWRYHGAAAPRKRIRRQGMLNTLNDARHDDMLNDTNTTRLSQHDDTRRTHDTSHDTTTQRLSHDDDTTRHDTTRRSHLAPMAIVTSSLTDDIRTAASNDIEYGLRLAAPPAGFEACGGLLWHGAVMCVPNDTTLRTRLISECHDSVTGAHLGRDKTLESMRSRFEWDGMTSTVERYVATCDACQRNKPSRQLTPGLLMPLPLPDRPCLEWTQDAVTGLPKTKRGHDAIQVYVERLCKLKHFTVSHSTDGAVELARNFVHTVVRAHGVPESVVSDRDPRITAHYYKELSRLMGTDLNMSTARHPQSDGQSEHEIQTLITALRSFCNAHQDDWDEYLDMIELGFNSSVQASTQHSPFELLYGNKPRLPLDVALASIAPRVPAAIDRASRMQQALEFARKCLLDAQERQTRNANEHRRVEAFKVGDAVLLTTEGLQLRNFTNKLCSRFIGPFRVTAVVNANAYTLELPPQLQALHSTFNISKLKRYRDGASAFPDRPLRFNRPPPEAEADSNGDQAFEVERIVAQRKRGRSMQYLVAWKGYPPEENTWQSRSDLAKSKELLEEFEANQQDEELRLLQLSVISAAVWPRQLGRRTAPKVSWADVVRSTESQRTEANSVGENVTE